MRRARASCAGGWSSSCRATRGSRCRTWAGTGSPSGGRTRCSPGSTTARYVYFVHSYHAVPEDPSLLALEADHGVRVSPPRSARTTCSRVSSTPRRARPSGCGCCRTSSRSHEAVPRDRSARRPGRAPRGGPARPRDRVPRRSRSSSSPTLARDGADRLHVVDLDGAFGEPPPARAGARDRRGVADPGRGRRRHPRSRRDRGRARARRRVRRARHRRGARRRRSSRRCAARIPGA